MTNAEKYLKEGVDINQMATEMVDYFNFPPYEGIGESSIEEFFDKEAKPTLTEDERVILRNIQDNQKVIFNDGSNLWTRDVEGEDNFFGQFNHLFQFIKERRRI